MKRYIGPIGLKIDLALNYTCERGKTLEEIIDDQPCADVRENVHAKWTLNDDGSGTCSRCRRTQKCVWDYDNFQNYCGHCGAQMEL